MTCSFEGCDKEERYGSGLCNAHYQQRLRGSELKPLRSRRPDGSVPARRPERYTAMRAWLKENGHEVPARGRVPQHLQQLFFDANV